MSEATTKEPRQRGRKAGKEVAQPVGFTIDNAEFRKALATCGLVAASGKGFMAILSDAKVHVTKTRCVFTATDLEQTVQLTVPVSDGVPGDFVLPLRTFTNVVKTLPDDSLRVTFADGEVTLTAKNYHATLITAPLENFPAFAPIEGEPVSVDALGLRAAIKRTTPAASTDDARAVLGGVYCHPQDGKLRMVATDSYRLSVAVTDIDWSHSAVLIPASALDRLNRSIDPDVETIDVTIGERAAEFRYAKTVFQTRLIEGEYPKYQQLIPAKQPIEASLDRERLAEACVRAKALIQDSGVVRLTLTAGGVEPYAVTQDVGHGLEAITAACTNAGKPLDDKVVVAFNPDYLHTGVRLFESQTLRLHLTDPMKPVLITADDVESFYLQMPVRVP